jgi:hypothetical protein
VVEGATLLFTNQATDIESPPQSLTFSLRGAPTNATINPASGVFAWTTTEMDGPGTNVISVVVTDDGSPSLSATQSFAVVILESNVAPVLAAIADRTVHAGTLVQFTNTATDADWPVNVLTFSLAGAPPAGAAINSSTGLFTWLTQDADVNTTNRVAACVTDNGTPSLSHTNQFKVLVIARPVIETIEVTNGLVTLSWSAIPGQTYRLQSLEHLTDTNWADVLPETTATNASVVQSALVLGADQKFYRVRVMP